MSNYLAVATVTAALQRLLQRSVTVDMPGAAVTTSRPGSNRVAAALAVNVYLYQISTNTARTNEDLPTHRSDGSLVQKPRAYLDLHYLISFHGDDTEMEPERLLGSTVRTLNSQPVLAPSLLQEVIAAASAQPPVHPGLAAGDLATSGDIVRLRPESLDLEQLSKLWSVLLQTPYVLSTTYIASSVVIEGIQPPQPVRPVITPAVAVNEHVQPHVLAVVDAADPLAPITAASRVRLSGSGLGDRASIVSVNGVDLSPVGAGPTYLDIDMTQAPPYSLRAGMPRVSVTHLPQGARSDPVAMTLHPRLLAAKFANGSVNVEMDLAVGPDQTAALRLLDAATANPALLVTIPPPAAPTRSLSVAVPGLAKGTFAAVVIVDGAPSTPTQVVTVP